MKQEQLAAHNVVATYDSMATAHEVISSLEFHGVGADDISLLGPAAEAAEAETDTAETDTAVIGEAVKGTAIGALAGSAAGFVAGLAAFAIPGVGPVIGRGIWAFALAAAHGGALTGGVLGGVASLKLSEAWELTLQETKRGRVLVAVHSDNVHEIDRAEDILRHHHPIRVERFDARGRRQAAA